MKTQKTPWRFAIRHLLNQSISLWGFAGLALISSGFPATEVMAKEEQDEVIEEIIVQARRRDESAQDVSISMNVFNQEQLDNANITNPSDLAIYAPSLHANNRFGSDNATFAIRGFSQELRTTASVGVYFAEVVAPRGSNTQQSGDGASPGDMFDLASVQVLKGPQGTLFGRNTTGGAVLLVPNKPTDEFEGYVELSGGNYDMKKQQVVLNLPVTDNFKLRFGADHQERTGYLDNFSGIGPDNFADSKYTAYRLSALWNITESLENYTIIKNSESDNNGFPGSLFLCWEGGGFGAVLGTLCKADVAARQAAGNTHFHDVYNFVPEPVNEQRLSQIVNTTTWNMSDTLTVKNILAYTTLETEQRTALFGENFTWLGLPFIFQEVGLADFPTTDQKTLVEEIQVLGEGFDGRLTWQAGLYYENSSPREDYGAQSPALITCDQDSITLPASQSSEFLCRNTFAVGSLTRTEGGVHYINRAVYAQGTYALNDMVSATLGLRYTNDSTFGSVTETIYYFPMGSLAAPSTVETDKRSPRTESEEPTWLLGVDFKPIEDVLLYAKYARGYRQGSVNLAGSDGFDKHDPEQVDTYEIGAKTQFDWVVPGTFNIAGYYNDFKDQQIQYGYFKTSNIGTTAITNAGKSKIWGYEVDSTFFLPGDVFLSLSYSYLNTEVKELEPVDIPLTVRSSLQDSNVTTAEGEPLSFAPKNKVVATLAWTLPVNPEAGDMKLAVTYVYTDEVQAVGSEYSALAKLPQYELWNLNFNWNSIFGSQFDVSAFITNLKDKDYITYIAGTHRNGLEAGAVSQPRMYGMRVKYNFGDFH